MRSLVLFSLLAFVSACMFKRGAMPRIAQAALPAHVQPSSGERQPVGPVFWVVDGKTLGPDSTNSIARRIGQLDASDIVSVQVLKGKAALKRYGRDASGGAVIVTTRAGSAGVPKDAERP